MDDKKFNLLEEPWVCVMQENGEVKELSLIDALIHAHQYRRLSGELPTQDVAVLRLLLAVLQTVVYRYDADGNEDELVETEDAYERWEEIWNEGKLPEKPIREYLAKWKERFYLYDSNRPFYQVPKAAIGTECKAANIVNHLTEDLKKAAGDCSGEKTQYGKEEYFYQIDIPFRRWLKELDPIGESDSEYYENIRNDWRVQAYRIAEKLGMNYVEQAGDKAFVGREIQEKKDGVERKVYYSSSSAFNIFKVSLKKCFEQ